MCVDSIGPLGIRCKRSIQSGPAHLSTESQFGYQSIIKLFPIHNGRYLGWGGVTCSCFCGKEEQFLF